jgi:hypothetical protein
MGLVYNVLTLFSTDSCRSYNRLLRGGGSSGQLASRNFSKGLGRKMRKFHLILWAIPLVVAISGCGAGGAGMFKARGGQAAGIDAAAKPLDTTAIQTQTLGPAPAGSAPATGRVIGAAPAAPAAMATAPATTQSTTATAAPASPQTAAEIGAAAAAALQAGATATTAAVPQSPEEAACVQDGGRWGKAGETGAMACFHPMKDAGKSCSKESDCSSQCLARSRSCAPFWPMFGCTDVVQNDGAVVQLCLN